ncbi:MAG: WbqC family protein [Pseudobdellovibrionaceae bacterium]|jgi:hypothetical protein|nr:WbqC family protein [Pseudobdellovibrionaceae bacterium]
MTKIGIMQPYFLPYLGYWQLIKSVDTFVLYDTVQYTKKGWMTRNRYLLNGKDEMFSLSVKRASSELDVVDRELADDFDRGKLLRILGGAYSKAPYFKQNFPLIEEIVQCPWNNLFSYIEHSIYKVCEALEITTPIVKSSDLKQCSRTLKGPDRVMDICLELGADEYINPIGGLDLYKRDLFLQGGINLKFLRSSPMTYLCFGQRCIPHMSIVDLMMFNSLDRIAAELNRFSLE